MGGELGIVTGEPGVGKTSAARRYAAFREEVYLVTMSPAASSLKACLQRVAHAIYACPSKAGAAAWSEAIRARFAEEWDHPPLLVIDEAQHLSDAAIEELRAISDATPRLGMVFMGSRELRERWSGRRWSQLSSRFYQRIDLERPMAADIDAICAAAGIDGKRPRELIRKTAARPGGLRLVGKLISVATALAGPDQPIKAEHIEAAFNDRGEASA
jgi:DNA transposition AAA+ family ATPase